MIQLRLSPKLRNRVDPSDILQEAFAECVRRFEEYSSSAQPKLEFPLWVRWIAGEKLLEAHRRHLGAAKRSTDQECVDGIGGAPESSCLSLAELLADSSGHEPRRRVELAESIEELQRGLEELDPLDREVLVLRHFEQLSGEQIAVVLGISAPAAYARASRALRRLRDLLPNA